MSFVCLRVTWFVIDTAMLCSYLETRTWTLLLYDTHMESWLDLFQPSQIPWSFHPFAIKRPLCISIDLRAPPPPPPPPKKKHSKGHTSKTTLSLTQSLIYHTTPQMVTLCTILVWRDEQMLVCPSAIFL